MTWKAVLSRDHQLGAQAWDTVENIAQAVLKKEYSLRTSRKAAPALHEEGLLYAYVAIAADDIGWATRATECLNQAIDNASQMGSYLGLFGGLTGLGWTVEHVSDVLSRISIPEDAESELPESQSESEQKEPEEDLCSDIDTAVLKALPRLKASSAYDLISGPVGFGTYFLERLPRKSAAEGVQAVFEHLEKLSERADVGLTWHSGPELLPEWQREKSPNGYYNLGVAHGIPGIIHFLGQAYVSGAVDPERCYRLLNGAMSWLMAKRQPAGALSWFSSWIVPGQEPAESRLAWCYGDLGIVSVLLQVSRQTGRSDWMAFAHELLDHCLAWVPERSGIVDAPLCHGAVGVAHIFNRIYQAAGNRRCLDAAIEWYQRAMNFREVGKGVGGFASLTRPDLSGDPVWEPNPAFLDGAVGIALAFLAAVTPIEPGWDRLLLVSGKKFL